jgi:two-component system, LytTR family, response regulator
VRALSPIQDGSDLAAAVVVSGPETAAPGAAKLKCLVVEGDASARQNLCSLLTASPELDVLAGIRTASEAHVLIASHSLDVVFLAAELPDGLGFDLLPELRPGTQFVFVTGSLQHALRAFECEATDFLLKPVCPGRLHKTILRLQRRRAEFGQLSRAHEAAPLQLFPVRTATEKVFLEPNRIQRIVADGEYSRVYWGDGMSAMLRKSLKQWEAELPAEEFVRVHRRAIVNLRFLERVEKLPKGTFRIHLAHSDEPTEVSLRLASTVNRKLKLLSQSPALGRPAPPWPLLPPSIANAA